MSHTRYEPVRTRLQRSMLMVPGSQMKFFAKALESAADYVCIDLEDAVVPDDKEQARKNTIEALNTMDWRGHGKTMSVRINGLDTHYMYRDVVDLVEQAGNNVDVLLVPKVGVSADIYMVDAMLSQIEQGFKMTHHIGIEALIETALGLANVNSIATSSPRLEAMHFGPADLAASLRARTVNIGGLNPDYPGDQWHYHLSAMVTACRAYGLRPIDGPFGDISDPEGFLDAGKRVAALGFEGKWAIHPSQVSGANEVFTPSEKESDKARRMLVALDEAAAAGKGAAVLDGKMIDAASARMAENVVRLDDEIKLKASLAGVAG
jgi:malyl-CoA/(S)-citramalyl-CoA lyase